SQDPAGPPRVLRCGNQCKDDWECSRNQHRELIRVIGEALQPVAVADDESTDLRNEKTEGASEYRHDASGQQAVDECCSGLWNLLHINKRQKKHEPACIAQNKA